MTPMFQVFSLQNREKSVWLPISVTSLHLISYHIKPNLKVWLCSSFIYDYGAYFFYQFLFFIFIFLPYWSQC